ncbi:hypothetical protein D9V41_09970 [Aeromicrobium phragmitis]|uniref:Uncharacterized protein n=1 Tax=Aeromicrobium phragmitis TaxID=2478914 RepID=A0A3L8PK73_9ACTN|nr:hypothetical protein D9V41_09970 [Aeromicrobium phragmitis]
MPLRADPDVVAALRAQLPEDLAHLPLTSAAEYRQEAWKAWTVRPPANGAYYPALGLRGAAAMATGFMTLGGLWMVIAGPSSSAGALEIILTLSIFGSVTVLLAWSKGKSNRKARRLQERNTVLSDVSAQIDHEVEQGRIPLKPAGWEGKIFPPL